MIDSLKKEKEILLEKNIKLDKKISYLRLIVFIFILLMFYYYKSYFFIYIEIFLVILFVFLLIYSSYLLKKNNYLKNFVTVCNDINTSYIELKYNTYNKDIFKNNIYYNDLDIIGE
jgi:hypothetical protein